MTVRLNYFIMVMNTIVLSVICFIVLIMMMTFTKLLINLF